MNAHILIRVAAVALLGCFATSPLAAQGGLLRRAQQEARNRIESIVGSERATPAASTGSHPSSAGTAGPVLLTMDAALLDRFAQALTAEAGVRDEWVAFEQGFARCQGTMQTSEAVQQEMMRLMERMAAEMESARTPEEIARVSEGYQAGMDGLMKKHCGAGQAEYDERRGRVNDQALQAALSIGRLSEGQYALLKERVVPFCRAGAGTGRVPGPVGGGHFYVYSSEEIAALGPRCGTLMPALERTI